MRIVVLIILGWVGVLTHGDCQHQGVQWMLGYTNTANSVDEGFSLFSLDFRSEPPEIHLYPEAVIVMGETNASICDAEGEPLLWTNGMEIMGKGIVHVAPAIAEGEYWDWFAGDFLSGFPKYNSALVFEKPGAPGTYQVLYHNADRHPENYHAIDRILLAEVTYEEEEFAVLFQDSVVMRPEQWLNNGMIATRHANGQDWWIVAFESDSELSYSMLLDGNGLRIERIDTADAVVLTGLGQTSFSRDGDMIVRNDAVRPSVGQILTVYDFDRCTGEVTLRDTFMLESDEFKGSAISPNDRFLYGDVDIRIYQWDLEAGDPQASRITLDTLEAYTDPGWFRPYFGPFTRGMDGRVYSFSSNATSMSVHVIERPDLKGKACRLNQHSLIPGVRLNRPSPNVPNYRLGPVDGSPCDTLDIDNMPVSAWRYEVDDSIDLETIRFTDLSYFNPEEWLWDFDDGMQAEVQHPVHTFPGPGLYHVCLTVSNANATDSMCQWVEIDMTSSAFYPAEPEETPRMTIAPNPFSETIRIDYPDDKPLDWKHVRLVDMHGQVIYDRQMPIPSIVHLEHLPAGTYGCILFGEDGTVLDTQVVVKLR